MPGTAVLWKRKSKYPREHCSPYDQLPVSLYWVGNPGTHTGTEDWILSVLSGSCTGHPRAEPRPAESRSSQYLLYTCAVNTCVSVLRNSINRGMPHSLPSLRVSPSYTCLQPLPGCCLPASVYSFRLMHVFGGMYTGVEHCLTLSLLDSCFSRT